MVTVFFTEGPVVTFQDAKRTDTELFKRFFHGLSSNRKWLGRWLGHPECSSGSCSSRGRVTAYR